MYVVILAGGGGTRLWPLSGADRPKPFLPLLGDRSLLQLTADRAAGLVGSDDVFIVGDRRHAGLIRTQLPDGRLVAEPAPRNTAAAIALAAAAIERDDDEVMVVLPADQWIADVEAFQTTLAAAATLAAGAFDLEEPLVTLGIRPDGPSTAYGYLRPDLDRGATIAGLRAYPLVAFEEKPSEARATELYGISGTAWNAGMFLWTRRAIRAALERYTSLPTLIEPAVRSELALELAYERINAISIDYAVMEGAAQDHRVVMAAMDVGWSDLGSWSALLAAIGVPASGRVVPPGEGAAATTEDLVLESIDGRLVLSDGPRDILAPTPVALLVGARSRRDIIERLLDRVEAREGRG